MKIQLTILLIFCLTSQLYALTHDIGKRNMFQDFLKFASKYVVKTGRAFLATDNNINDDNINTDDTDTYIPVMEEAFYGQWTSISNDYSHQFGDFSGYTGYSAFTADDDSTAEIDDELYFWFYDGQYIDKKVAIVYIKYDNQTDFNPANSTFMNSNISFTLYSQDNFEQTGETTCTGSYQLSFVDSTNGQPYNKTLSSPLNAVAYFWLNSSECSISIQSTVATANSVKESKALDYSLMVTFICLVNLYASIQMLKNMSQNTYDGSRYSLMTLGFFTIWDIFMCLLHLYDALTIQDFFHYFITPAFWYFILSAIFETRLILMVWNARYYQSYRAVNELRRGLTIFYLKFYGLMILILFLAYNFLPAVWLLCLTSAFFVPQIVHNAMRGQKYRFDFTYVFLLGLVRIATPLYVRGCPFSIFKLTPSNDFIVFYVGFIMFQIFILYLQMKLGSRFFIPRCFLPPKYNYYRKLAVDAPPEEADTCSICMENLNEVVVSSTTALLSSRPKQVTIMVTPCQHKFHPSCLRQWLEIKLECPFCRAPAPPVD